MFLRKILDFVSFLARTISLVRSLGKFLSSSVSWEDQLYFLRRFLATSFSFSRFSWQDLRLFQFSGKIPNFLARSYTCWIVWQGLILPEFHGKILDCFSLLAKLIIHLQFLGRILPSSVSWEDQLYILVFLQDPILLRFLGKIIVLLAKSYSFCVSWQDKKYFLGSAARS